MKVENLYDAIQNIDDKFITEAALASAQPIRRKPTKVWLKAASVAACFMGVLLSISLLLNNSNVHEKNNPLSTSNAGYNVGHDDETLDNVILVDFDNINYWVVGKNQMHHSDVKDFPAEITDDLIGEYLGEGVTDDSLKIKIPVYACAIADCEYLRIGYYNGQYRYMTFSNFTDGAIYNPRSLARMLAVNDSSKIMKITVKKLNEPEMKVIEDLSVIDEFWNAFTDAEVINFKEFENRVYADKTEEEIQELCEEMASNAYIITLFLQNGIQHQIICDEYQDVYYIGFISYSAVMHDELKQLVS